MTKTANTTLWIFLISGLVGSISISWSTFQGVNPCPLVWIFRACYLVLMAYFSMSIAQVMRSRKTARWTFWAAWTLAFVFALYGTVSELLSGNVCPQSNAGFPFYETPMCYISLMFCIVIALADFFISRDQVKH